MQRFELPNPLDADATIDACLDISNPTSFFLFAGAGSGKTRSLVRALEELRKRSGAELRLYGRQIAVITYTNAARDEISRRLQFDPLIAVSTIHSFVWDQIRGFDRDIRDWLKASINQQIAELEEAQQKGRKGQASVDRAEKIRLLHERGASLTSIQKFIYSPTSDNRTRDSLNHAEVIKIGANFLETKVLMQRLLVSRYPVLLIDESQDTNKALVEAFFKVQSASPNAFCLGLFGDMMQRIYADGKLDLGRSLPEAWKRPAKLVNHRSPKRVIQLINKIRLQVDDHQQEPRTDAKEGLIRFFIAKGETANRPDCEKAARETMAAISGDTLWNDDASVKMLMLEHHMAAERLGFAEIFAALDTASEFSTGLRDGSLPVLTFFTQLVLPLVAARRRGDKFAVASLVREDSPLLDADALNGPEANPERQLEAARDAVEKLAALLANDQQPTLREVLILVATTKLFSVPSSLTPFVTATRVESNPDEAENAEQPTSGAKALEAIRQFLGAPFGQVEQYAKYVNGESPLATHQGVKGLEFPRVLVVMDDAEARGFMFNFEKFFGAEAPSPTDLKNERDGKETGIDRTRRLFYVTCSRAREGLALVAYTKDPSAVKRTLIERGWFADCEIQML